METIIIRIVRDDVYEEVAKATDYTGSKLIDGDATARDRILAVDEDLASLGRFWDETCAALNEALKAMLISGRTKTFIDASEGIQKASSTAPSVSETASGTLDKYPEVMIGKIGYEGRIEVSKSFDKALTDSVESTLRSYFIASIIGQWFKFANKGEASDYLRQAAEMLESAERLLYSRKKPSRPSD